MVCTVASPTTVLAWGDDGHKIVGLIAQHYLNADVLTQVNALLAGDTTGLVSPTDIPDEATWADKYRDSDRNTTQVHYNQTHNWHFVDLELSGPDLNTACYGEPALPAGTLASAGPANDCIVDKIAEFQAELADTALSTDERRMALQFLLHFVGDVHQPLHASDDNDAGGNDKKTNGAGTASNLHASWDTPFVTALGSSDSAIANSLIAAITSAQLTQWGQGDAAAWAQEAYQASAVNAYGKLPAPNSDGSYTLSSSYVSNAKTIVKQQLSRAGVRLAYVVNTALAGGSAPPPPPPGGTQLLGNPGFEQGSNAAPWTASAGVISNNSYEPPHSGSWMAWLDGYGTTTTNTLQQTVTLPAGTSQATLSFWLHIDTDETTTSSAYDKLTVQLLSSSGQVLKTLATYSNLNAAGGYQPHSFDVSVYHGQSVTLKFTGSEDYTKQTSFVIDDCSLLVQ
jgi:hypothetical protein